MAGRFWYASAVRGISLWIHSLLILFLIARLIARINFTRRHQRMVKPFTHPDYEKLPEAIKAQVSEKEYAWLPESDRQRVVDEFTMPEATED